MISFSNRSIALSLCSFGVGASLFGCGQNSRNPAVEFMRQRDTFFTAQDQKLKAAPLKASSGTFAVELDKDQSTLQIRRFTLRTSEDQQVPFVVSLNHDSGNNGRNKIADTFDDAIAKRNFKWEELYRKNRLEEAEKLPRPNFQCELIYKDCPVSLDYSPESGAESARLQVTAITLLIGKEVVGKSDAWTFIR